MNTKPAFSIVRDLGTLENEILDSIVKETQGGAYEMTRGYAVWINERGDIQMGTIRWAHEYAGTAYYSCSPFPGAWTDVPRGNILRVSAPAALVDYRTAGELIDARNEYLDKWSSGRGVTHRPVA